MVQTIIALTLAGSLQTARAEGIQAPVQDTQAAITEEAKSFFETRTLQDIQQLVHFDAKSLNEQSPDAKTGGAG